MVSSLSYKSEAGVANKLVIFVQSKLLRLVERGVWEAEEEDGVAATFNDGVVTKLVKGADVFLLLLLLLTLPPLLLIVVQLLLMLLLLLFKRLLGLQLSKLLLLLMLEAGVLLLSCCCCFCCCCWEVAAAITAAAAEAILYKVRKSAKISHDGWVCYFSDFFFLVYLNNKTLIKKETI